MPLTEPERVEVWASMMRRASCPASITKSEFRAAVNAADDWAESNASSFNAALPQPYRSAAGAAEKALLLAFVCLKRAGL